MNIIKYAVNKPIAAFDPNYPKTDWRQVTCWALVSTSFPRVELLQSGSFALHSSWDKQDLVLSSQYMVHWFQSQQFRLNGYRTRARQHSTRWNRLVVDIKIPLAMLHLAKWHWVRRYQARPLAWAVSWGAAAKVQFRRGLDQDHQWNRGGSRKIQQGGFPILHSIKL